MVVDLTRTTKQNELAQQQIVDNHDDLRRSSDLLVK